MEYDVYTDGVNDFIFDRDKKLIGYCIKTPQNSTDPRNHGEIIKEEISKYADFEKLTLNAKFKTMGETYYTYSWNENVGVTNNIVKARVDMKGNVTDLFIYYTNIGQDTVLNPDINDRTIKEILKEIDQTLEYVRVKNKYDCKDESGNLFAAVTILTSKGENSDEVDPGNYPLKTIRKNYPYRCIPKVSSSFMSVLDTSVVYQSPLFI